MLAAVATAMPETLIPVIAILGPMISGGGRRELARDRRGRHPRRALHALARWPCSSPGWRSSSSRARGRRGTEMRVNVQGARAATSCFFLVGYAHRHRDGLPARRGELAAAGWPPPCLFVIYAVYVRAPLHRRRRGGRAEDLNRLHLTRLPGLAGPQRVDIDILPGETRRRESRGGSSRGCGSSSARCSWRWR